MCASLSPGSQYSHLIARRIREANVFCELYSCLVDLETLNGANVVGIILSGGPSSVYEEGSPHVCEGFFDWAKPVLARRGHGARARSHRLSPPPPHTTAAATSTNRRARCEAPPLRSQRQASAVCTRRRQLALLALPVRPFRSARGRVLVTRSSQADALAARDGCHRERKLPILGICYGMQEITHTFGGRVAASAKREFGHSTVKKVAGHGAAKGDLFWGLGDEEQMWMSHGDKVEALPAGFEAIASTDTCPFAAIAGPADQHIYGLQFHPEVTHSPRGKDIILNFAVHICKLSFSLSLCLPLSLYLYLCPAFASQRLPAPLITKLHHATSRSRVSRECTNARRFTK